jgi:Right handed beta helix region
MGVNFKDSASSFLEPHAVPSAGDWALERIAALFFEGVERLVVYNCTVSRAGGNGMMLSGYSRDALLSNNTLRWTGGSAMAAWGRTDEISDGGVHGFDATSGDFPQRTTVSSNLVTETGVWEKQSSCWFQAKAAQTTLVGNVCFNLGRAGLNFNDGLGGGDEVHFNAVFNTNRESADHGPANSWDR